MQLAGLYGVCASALSISKRTKDISTCRSRTQNPESPSASKTGSLLVS